MTSDEKRLKNRDYMKKYRNTESGRRKSKEALKRYLEKNKEEIKRKKRAAYNGY